MCYLPVRGSGRTRSQRTHGDAELEDEREEYTAGTHPFFAPRKLSRSVDANYSYLCNYFNRQDLRDFNEEKAKAGNTSC